MFYGVLADLVVFVHVAFIIFVVLGGALSLRWHWVAWIHVPAAVWGAAVELLGWFCPLTPLENHLREASGAAGYSTGFVERYLIPIVYPVDLTREAQLLLGCAVVGVNAAIYLFVWRRVRRVGPRP